MLSANWPAAQPRYPHRHMAVVFLAARNTVGAFEEKSGSGIAIQIDIEDAVGLSHQIAEIQHEIEDQI